MILKKLGDLPSKFYDVRNLSAPSHVEPVHFELTDRHARNARLRVKPLTDTVREDQNIANIACAENFTGEFNYQSLMVEKIDFGH